MEDFRIFKYMYVSDYKSLFLPFIQNSAKFDKQEIYISVVYVIVW